MSRRPNNGLAIAVLAGASLAFAGILGSIAAHADPTIGTYIEGATGNTKQGIGVGILSEGPSYVLTSTGFQQVASFSTATGFTPPSGSTTCFIQTESNSVRFRTDGTNPTATVGQLLAVGALLIETANLPGIKFIPTSGTATLDVDCYK